MKKIITIISIIFIILTVGVFFLNAILFTGFADPLLRIKIIFSPDKIVKTFACEKNLSWRVIEKNKFQEGNLFELSRPSRIQTYRNLQLLSSNSVLSEMTAVDFKYPYYVNNTPGNAHEFPTAESFVKAYVFREDGILTGPQAIQTEIYKKDPRWQLRIQDSKIGINDFDVAARCLYKNLPEVEQLLSISTNLDRSYAYPIGWLMLLDKSKFKRNKVITFKTYKCTDGSRIIMSGYNVLRARKNKDGNYIPDWRTYRRAVLGIIGTDGKLYKKAEKNLGIDMTQPQIKLSNLPCIDENGNSLEVQIASIPNKIIILK